MVVSAVETPAGECGRGRQEDGLGRSGRVPNSGGIPSSGLDPAVLQVLVTAATTKNQIRAAATSTAAAMEGGGFPPLGGGAIVTPGGPSTSLLEPGHMRDVMAGNDAIPSGTHATATYTATLSG